MNIGYGSISLDPPNSLPMEGYIFRKGTSLGTHDPLKVHAVSLKDTQRDITLLIFDLIGIPDKLLKYNFGKTIIPIATHTHSGPDPLKILNLLEEKAKLAIDEADKNTFSIEKIIIKKGKVKNVCSFREKEKEKELPVNLIIFEGEKRLGLIIYPCHPTVLGPENLYYSKDLAGAIGDKLSKKYGFPVIYINSCSGNISTHKTRKERTFEEIERLSSLFITSIKWEKTKSFSPYPIQYTETILKLPLQKKDLSGVNVGKRDIPGIELLKNKKLDPSLGLARLSILYIGSIKILFTPFELFYETCKKLDDTITICYANGYRPYLVPSNVKEGYEWIISPYTDSAEEKLFETVKNLLEKRYKKTL